MNIDPEAEVSTPSLIDKIKETPEQDDELSIPMRFRTSSSMEQDLNLVEAYFRGQGFRNVNRSHLLRIAVANLITTVNEELAD